MARRLGKCGRNACGFRRQRARLVHRYDLNGFDIDFESARVGEEDMLTLAREIRRSLNKIPSTRPMIMTIAPDQTGGLNKDVLEQFTYVMAQTYGHACSCFSFDDTDLLAEQLVIRAHRVRREFGRIPRRSRQKKEA